MAKLTGATLCAILLQSTLALEPLSVAVLSKHNPDSWSDDANCGEDGSLEFMQCNLRLYEAAINKAASLGAELFVFPEAYGISGNVSPTSFIEPWVSDVGSDSPCDTTDANDAPAQVTLACAAREFKLEVLANIFVSLPNGTKYINSVVYDSTGYVVATYTKNHLFPSEDQIFTPGPFQPTTFTLKDYVIGDWSQMDGLKALGANTFAWSIGSFIPQPFSSKVLAMKYDVGVFASEDYTYGTILDASGESSNSTDYALNVEGNTGKAAVRFSQINQ